MRKKVRDQTHKVRFVQIPDYVAAGTDTWKCFSFVSMIMLHYFLFEKGVRTRCKVPTIDKCLRIMLDFVQVSTCSSFLSNRILITCTN